MDALLPLFRSMSLPQASFWLLVENVLLFFLALTAGHLLIRFFSKRPVGPPPEPLERREVWLAVMCVVLNTAVTIAGWWLWTHDWIVIRTDTGPRAWLDVLILLALMDFAMYVFHRTAHLKWLYPLVHVTHHRYDKPRPINLFVLSPFEVAGFGGLWLAILCCFHFSWLGIVAYMTLNLAFGTLGHLGVEPFPRSWAKWKILRHVGTSTFHAGHHQDAHHNFGFYTLIWDRLFGTLNPKYAEDFGQETPPGAAPAAGRP